MPFLFFPWLYCGHIFAKNLKELEACKYLCNVVFYYCGKRELQEKVGTTLQFDAFELFFMHFQEC
jgi:hypothetical protein